MKQIGLIMLALILASTNVNAGVCATIGGVETIYPETVREYMGVVDNESNIIVGIDDRGYDYGSQSFNGSRCNFYFASDICEPNEPPVEATWNDAYLSTTDCDNDNRLDRHLGFDSYIGSGAELQFKMVEIAKAAPVGAYKVCIPEPGVPNSCFPYWADKDGNLLGERGPTDFYYNATIDIVCSPIELPEYPSIWVPFIITVFAGLFAYQKVKKE